MLVQQVGGPSTGNEYTTSPIIAQNNSLLGTPQVQSLAGANNPQMPSYDPQMINSTQNQNVMSMVKALQGG